jgi:hypothetical protein
MGANDGARGTEHGRPYVDRILEDTQRYAHDLLTENERLRLLVASLENQRVWLEERDGVLQGIERENQALQDLLASIEGEKQRLNEQLLALRDDSERHAREHSRLREELTAIEERSQRFSQQFQQIERQSSNLANLYVATYQLHGTLDRDEVLASIQEILANLVGTEQTAVFEVVDGGRRLVPLCVNGLDAARYRTIEVGSGPIGRAADSGEMFLCGPGGTAERAPEEPDLTACIPLKLSGKVIGVIAVFRLLPQKPGLEHLDRELFDLLATHAATALYCASLHCRAGVSEELAS